jgi:large subunit ribosomal protein L15
MMENKKKIKSDKPGVIRPEVKKPAKAAKRKIAVVEKPRLSERSATPSIGLHNLRAPQGAHKKKKLLGRGPSSGHGKTSTRGFKGQTSRAGRDFYRGFEGGQTPLIRRIPKRGFNNTSFTMRYQVINLKDLTDLKETVIDLAVLEDKGLIRDKDKPVKILGDGGINTSVTVKAHAFSKQAKEKIEKAGGKIEIINV